MKNTLENKARFFALYYGTETLSVFNSICLINYNSLDATAVKSGHLELTPLSSITEEDKIEVIIRLNPEAKSESKEDILEAYILVSAEYLRYGADYLRSKGYSLPFMGLSVDTLIEYGWIKLKTK